MFLYGNWGYFRSVAAGGAEAFNLFTKELARILKPEQIVNTSKNNVNIPKCTDPFLRIVDEWSAQKGDALESITNNMYY